MQKVMPTHIDTIICDDIRKEEGNKYSLMGVYGTEIYVNKLPFTFARFCVLQKWQDLMGVKEAYLKLMEESGNVLFTTEEPIFIGDVPENTVAFLSLIINNLEIKTEGRYSIETAFDPDGEPANKVEFLIKKMLPAVMTLDISTEVPPTAHMAILELDVISDQEGPAPVIEISDNPEMENAVSIRRGKGEFEIPVKNQKFYMRTKEGGVKFTFHVKGYEEQL